MISWSKFKHKCNTRRNGSVTFATFLVFLSSSFNSWYVCVFELDSCYREETTFQYILRLHWKENAFREQFTLSSILKSSMPVNQLNIVKWSLEVTKSTLWVSTIACQSDLAILEMTLCFSSILLSVSMQWT